MINTMRFEKVPIILILIFAQLITNFENVNADSRSFEITKTIQFNCKKIFETGDDSHVVVVQNLQNSNTTQQLCGDLMERTLNSRGGDALHNETRDNSTKNSMEKPDEADDLSKSKFVFSLFQEMDGSKTDPDGIPYRYLDMQQNRRDAAKEALEETMKWREQNEIDTILARPHSKFDVCKKVFPHYFCGRDKKNHVVLLQRPGKIDLDLFRKNDLTGDDVLHHYIYVMEYLWQILEPKANSKMTSVIDLSGVTFSVLRRQEVINILKKFCTTMDAHFPQRAHKTLLINSPMWFSMLFNLLSPLLRESTKENIMILSAGKEQDEALESLLIESPFLENGMIKISRMEEDLRGFCLARLEESRSEMQILLE